MGLLDNGWHPHNLILHDYGGTPKNEDGVFNPYHALVFPDGSIRYRNPDDPYGSKAPHAYKMNGDSIGLSYAGQVGSQPTPEAMGTISSEYQKIQGMFPGIKAMSHGQAYEATKGTPAQASKDGRGLDEAAWRKDLPGFEDQTAAPAGPVPMANRSLTAFAGSQPAQQPAQPPQPTQLAENDLPTPMRAGAPAQTMTDAGPQPMIPKQEASMGGLFDGVQSFAGGLSNGISGLSDRLNSSMSSPLFQFGAGMAGAGGQGLGIGGGLAAGANQAGQGQKYATDQLALEQARQQQAYLKSLTDPNSPEAKALGPGASAAGGMGGNNGADLIKNIIANQAHTQQQYGLQKNQSDLDVKKSLAIGQGTRDMQRQQFEYLKSQRGAAGTQGGSTAPQPGAVMDGHRFKGGNPADPNSWEPL